MRGILVLKIMSIFPFLIFIICWQLYITETLSLPKTYVGALLAIFMLSQSIAGMFLAKKKIKNPYKDLIFAILISLIGLLIVNSIFFIDEAKMKFVVFIVGIVIYEFGLGIEQGSSGAWIQDYIPDNKRASYFSAITAILSLFAFVFTNIVGLIMQWKGYFFPFHIALAGYILYFLYAKLCRFGKVEEGK